MKKFSRSFQIFLDLPQIFLVRENYFSTDEKVFSIVKNISGSSKINLERQNYFLANKIILHQFCPEWLSILLLYLLLKLPGMTACPTVFPSRFNLLCLAQKIKKKSNFQLVFEPVISFKLFRFRLLFNDCPLAGNTQCLFLIFSVI